MKTVRLVNSENYPEQGYVVNDNEFMRDHLQCFVTSDGNFIMSKNIPIFDPYDGSNLIFIENK